MLRVPFLAFRAYLRKSRQEQTAEYLYNMLVGCGNIAVSGNGREAMTVKALLSSFWLKAANSPL